MQVGQDYSETPPPKPPRGVMRKTTPPMKPPRGILRIESENVERKFKASDLQNNMQVYFKRSIAVIRSNAEFTGTEAADVLESYITAHREQFRSENVGRANAVKLLNIWLKENVFRAAGRTDKYQFSDSDRAFYVLCKDYEHRLYTGSVSSPTTSVQSEDSEGISLSRSSRRSNSFKKLFSFGSASRKRSSSRGRENQTFLKSTFSLFSGEKREERRAARIISQAVKEEEAELYQASLLQLLNIIEVNFLEDFALPLEKDSNKNASFLTSILEKMGLMNNEERLDDQTEDEMDLLVDTHPLLRTASKWFRSARVCAPLLHLQSTPGKSPQMQMYLWCKQALTAASTRLEKLTSNGNSPLIPSEFGPLLSAIDDQLLDEPRREEKLKKALQYLWLMIPNQLRSTIEDVLRWLEWTLKSESVVDLRSPYYLGVKESASKENCKVIIEELRHYIIPRGSMSSNRQFLLIQKLLELQTANILGDKPVELLESLRAKRNAVDQENLPPTRYCSTPVKGSQYSNGAFNMDEEMIKTMEAIMDCPKLTLAEKKKKMQVFKEQYPKLFEQKFKHIKW